MRWERAERVGHRPKFDISCPFCKVGMVVRYSYAFPAGEPIYGMFEPTNQIAYKCHACGYHQRFNIPDTKEYIQSLYDERGKSHYSPVSDWEENEKIKEQLEALGYWG